MTLSLANDLLNNLHLVVLVTLSCKNSLSWWASNVSLHGAVTRNSEISWSPNVLLDLDLLTILRIEYNS